MKKIVFVLLLVFSVSANANCYVSFQKTTPTAIPDRVWVTLPSYPTQNTNTCPSIYNGSGPTFNIPAPHANGPYMLSAYIKWASNSEGQRLVRFIRNPGTTNDEFATNDRTATVGKDFVSHSYLNYVGNSVNLGVQVYQTSGGTLNVELGQFKISSLW